MDWMKSRVYYRPTTFSQRKYLFELVEELDNIAEASRRAKVSKGTYYTWKERYEQSGIEGLRHPKSHAIKNPKYIKPEIEQRIVELKREHPNWGKKRIAQEIWKEHNWEKAVAIQTVKNVLVRHNLWFPLPIKTKAKS